MDAPTYANILLNTQNEMDAITREFTFNSYNALAAYLSVPLGSLCVLYIILTGYAMLFGYVKTPVGEFKKMVLRIGFVYTFALNWGFFSEYFVNLFIASASAIGAVMMKATLFDVPVNTGSGVNGALQSVLIEIIRVGQWVFDKATFRHWSPAFTGIMIDLAGVVVVGFAFFELVIAKLMLSVMLCFAPLFFIFTLFDRTKGFFDRWLGILVGFSLVLIFVSTILGLCLHIMHITIAPHYTTQAATVTFSDWIPIVLMAALSLMALFEVTSIAKSIGGSCSSGGGSAMMGGFIGGAMGAASAAKSGGSNTKQLAGKGLNAVKSIAGGPAGQAAMSAMKGIQNKLRGGQ